jgi:hypothetical protein
MEMVVEEAGPTRRSRRERTKTTKAVEQEKMMHHGRSTQTNPSGTPNQGVREAWDQDESRRFTRRQRPLAHHDQTAP